MPNWVYNNLTIAPNAEAGGTIKDVADLVEQVGRAYTISHYDWATKEVKKHTVEEPEFTFWNIVRPEGEALEMYDESLIKPAASPYWYDWNCENWGTKWDASDVEFQSHGPDHKQYTFRTAWSPPLEALKALSEQHPNVHIELEWEEEQGFGGTFVFRGGEGVETEYYDVPSSHADFVKRGREDECGCTWGEADDYGFADCPTATPKEVDTETAIGNLATITATWN